MNKVYLPASKERIYKKHKKMEGGAGQMTIYYICEYCEQVFSTVETEGQEGSVEVKGICEECAMEMGLLEPTSMGGKQYFN